MEYNRQSTNIWLLSFLNTLHLTLALTVYVFKEWCKAPMLYTDTKMVNNRAHMYL